MRPIRKVVIHCSDSPDTLDIGKAEINEWHIQRGFSSCGYHFVIRRDGTVETGRPLEKIGAHVAGHNSDSIGICWVGRNKITDSQHTTLVSLVDSLLIKFKLQPENVYGHKELNPGKTCPNLDMDELRKEFSCRLPKTT